MISYGSVCSGIEAASVAWHSLGFHADWFSEIEAFPSAVLAHRWPDVPNLGDMTKLVRQVLTGAIKAPELMVGGTPCQAFSVAGMREGLADPRGALTIKYVELLDAIDHVRTQRGEPEAVCVWENVPGVLSDKGNAFGCFLGALVGESQELQPPGGKWKDAGCVYGPRRTVAWRVLDAQYFGLAQRRRRVFVVASARAGFDPAAVLFEREGVRRDHPPRRGEGQDVASTVAGGARKRGGYSTDDIPLAAFGGGGNTGGPIDVAACLVAKGQKCDFEVETFCVHGTQDPDVRVDQAHTLGRNNGAENAVFAIQAGALRTNPESGPDGVGVQADHAYTLEARAEVQAVCITGEITHTLKAEGFDASEDGTGRGQPIVATTAGGSYGSTTETNTVETLRALREAVGAEAFTQWGLGVLGSLQSPQVLRQDLHGCSVRCEACEGEPRMDDGASPCSQAGRARPLCEMREAGCQRRAPQGRRLAEQLSRELGAHLSELPHQGAQAKSFLQAMWQASEGLGILRQALPALQEMGRSIADEGQSAQRAAVRRLTPRETERLQGFPESTFTLAIEVCAEESRESVSCAGLDSAAKRREQSAPVVARVLIDCERLQVLQPSAGRSMSNAPSAVAQRESRQPTLTGDFVRLAALTLQELEREIRAGRVESLPSISGSSRPLSGSAHARLSGRVIDELVSDAERLTKDASLCTKSITSQLGRNSQSLGSTLEISLCCVAAAIVSSIPKTTQPGSSFVVIVETTSPYTLIPWRGKPAEECPDGPRYKAIGNSKAIPVVRWIGGRLLQQLQA